MVELVELHHIIIDEDDEIDEIDDKF